MERLEQSIDLKLKGVSQSSLKAALISTSTEEAVKELTRRRCKFIRLNNRTTHRPGLPVYLTTLMDLGMFRSCITVNQINKVNILDKSLVK